jgi:hypothetical protein
MNQIRNPAAPDGNRSIGDRRMTIEYDDGNPATIAPRDDRRTMQGTIGGSNPTAVPARCFRAPLATIERGGRVDYDDGIPGTVIVGEARGFE